MNEGRVAQIVPRRKIVNYVVTRDIHNAKIEMSSGKISVLNKKISN